MRLATAPEFPQRRVDGGHHPRVDGVDGGSRGASPLSGESGTIAIATWNIRSGRRGGVEAAARALDQMGVGVAVIQETKLMAGKHTRLTSGYKILA